MVVWETRETDDSQLRELGDEVVSPCHGHLRRHQVNLQEEEEDPE